MKSIAHEISGRIERGEIDDFASCRHCHMEICEPSLLDVCKDLQSQGTNTVLVHPLFISPFGKHVTKDIPRIVDDVSRSLPQMDVRLTKVFGEDDQLLVEGALKVARDAKID